MTQCFYFEVRHNFWIFYAANLAHIVIQLTGYDIPAWERRGRILLWFLLVLNPAADWFMSRSISKQHLHAILSVTWEEHNWNFFANHPVCNLSWHNTSFTGFGCAQDKEKKKEKKTTARAANVLLSLSAKFFGFQPLCFAWGRILNTLYPQYCLIFSCEFLSLSSSFCTSFNVPSLDLGFLPPLSRTCRRSAGPLLHVPSCLPWLPSLVSPAPVKFTSSSNFIFRTCAHTSPLHPVPNSTCLLTWQSRLLRFQGRILKDPSCVELDLKKFLST